MEINDSRAPARLGGSYLGVPLSVWPDASLPDRLASGLVTAYTQPDMLVLDATGNGAVLVAAVAAGRRGDGFCSADRADGLRARLDKIEFTLRVLGHVRLVDGEDVPAALFAYIDDVDLLVAGREVVEIPGWWRACHTAMTAGGHVAIVCDTADSAEHTRLIGEATSAGPAYMQRLVATTSEALDDAVAAARTPVHARVRAQTHRRKHTDVFVFSNPPTQAAS